MQTNEERAKDSYAEECLRSKKDYVCGACHATVKECAMAAGDYICPICGGYNRMPARVRIRMLADKDSFRELWADRVSSDILNFPGYKEKLLSAREESGENEGVITGVCTVMGEKCCLFVMDGAFMMGTMGTVLGDKLSSLFEYAIEERLPVVGYTVSGGTRMQEGMLSLLQMAKVAGAAKRHSDHGGFYLASLTDPTTGGITASFAMLGDVIIAEPHALIGFVGKRVIEQVTGEILPPELQSAELQLQNGFLDAIVPRREQRLYIANMLKVHAAR